MIFFIFQDNYDCILKELLFGHFRVQTWHVPSFLKICSLDFSEILPDVLNGFLDSFIIRTRDRLLLRASSLHFYRHPFS